MANGQATHQNVIVSNYSFFKDVFVSRFIFITYLKTSRISNCIFVGKKIVLKYFVIFNYVYYNVLIIFLLDVDCGKLPPLPYGLSELLNGTTHLGSVIQYSCTTNYRLVGAVRRVCTENYQWSDSSPRCEGKILYHNTN